MGMERIPATVPAAWIRRESVAQMHKPADCGGIVAVLEVIGVLLNLPRLFFRVGSTAPNDTQIAHARR